MKYVTLADLSRTIREQFYRIPRDIDYVLGVPRSGMLPATIIAEWLNVPCTDVDAFCSGAKPTGGGRLIFYKPSDRQKKRILVVDDTIFNGNSMRKTREKLHRFNDQYEFFYMVVYREGPSDNVALWLEDVRKYTDDYSVVLYEWNIFHHTKGVMDTCMYDIDGVFCLDPPDERVSIEAYQRYIKNATPLFTPTVEIGEIVSFRLASNEEITRQWLAENNIRYRTLTLFPAQTYQERAASGISPAKFKADIYRRRGWAKLFVESDDDQAQQIWKLTGKPVYCVKTNKMYC